MLPPAKREAVCPPGSSALNPRPGSALPAFARTVLLFSMSLGLFGSVAAAASSPPQSFPVPGLASNLALADFDGDRKPDLASVEFNHFDASTARYWITFRLTTGSKQTVEVIGPLGGLDISARDVNGDAALDLIVRTAWQHQIIAIFLNDGHGHFAPAADPSAFSTDLGNSSAVWLPAPRQGCEISALSFPGDPAGDCQGDSSISLSQAMRHFTFSRDSKVSRFAIFPSLGRAPPIELASL